MSTGLEPEPKTIRVAVVEDHDGMRDLLVSRIKGDPRFTCVASCRSGEEARTALPEVHPDVVVMDLRLPGISGVDSVRALKSQMPRTEFLILTMAEEPEPILDAIAAGATGYLLKRDARTGLLDAIADLVAGGSPMSPSVARLALNQLAALAQPSPDEEPLTVREEQILRLLARGRIYKEIADETGLSYHTVRAHLRNIYRKLRVTSRAGAIRAFRQRPSER